MRHGVRMSGKFLGTQSLTGSVSNYHVACGKSHLWAESQLGCFTFVLLLEGKYTLRDIH